MIRPHPSPPVRGSYTTTAISRTRLARKLVRRGRRLTGDRWTAEDEAVLQALLDAKTDLDLIVRKLKRNRPAIEKRIIILRKKRELGV
jgi:hypothetical protein